MLVANLRGRAHRGFGARPTRGALALGALLAFAVPALAQKDASHQQLNDKRSDLKEVQERIRDLQKEIAKSEEWREDAADALRETEQSISASQRRLRELADMRGEAEAELADVAERTRMLEQRIKVQQRELEKLLTRYYVSGQAQGLRHMLSGSDPNQLARDLYYLRQLSRSEADLIGGLRSSLAEQKSLVEQARVTRDALAEIEKEQAKEVASLAQQRQRHKTMLAQVSDRLRGQRKEVVHLKHDEQRLSKLIDGLAELARKQAAAAEKARRDALALEERRKSREAAEAAAREAAASTSPTPSHPVEETPLKSSAPIARVEQTPEAAPSGVGFEQLRGRMRLPVRGELMNRFGTPRADGGSSWRGVFIRATSGAEVKAIAAGKVVFADWLRGFGNLVILDHGAGYLSIYGYNDSLFHAVGQLVKAGDAVASVGASGGSEETGLYFELRHRGQPIDPLRWISLK